MRSKSPKEKQGVARLFELAGQRGRKLTLACVLSVLSSAARIVPFFTIYGVVRELLAHYQKFKITVLSYACFCLGIMGCPANLWFAGEAYWENIHTSMGDQYANTLQSLMPSWMLYVGFVLLFVGGILGALLGHKMLKKHFERAGIV